MPRTYTVSIDNGAFGLTVSDFAGYICAASKFARITHFWVDEVDSSLVATPFDLRLGLFVFQPNFTAGTGTVAATPQPFDGGDTAATGTGIVGPSTTLGTTTTTKRLIWPKGCHIYQGCEVKLPKPVPLLPGQVGILQILTALPIAAHLSGGIVVEEEG